MTRPSRIAVVVALAALALGCREPIQCGIFDYDEATGRCTCPAGTVELDDGTCFAGDAGSGDAGSRDDGCVSAVFWRDRDGDGFGDVRDMTSACDQPVGYADNSDDCDDDCASCRPGGAEVCDGARDEDCVGGIDQGCDCTGTATRPCPGGTDVGECSAGMQSCVGGSWAMCTGGVAPAGEICNGLDDDCDSTVDGADAVVACGTPARVLTAACPAASCVVGSCEAGYDDCDDEFANGCEAELASPGSCGGCGITCGWGCYSSACNDVRQIALGGEHSCVLRESAEVTCWGAGASGQLGNGMTGPAVVTNAPASFVVGAGGIGTLSGAVEIAAGFTHTCARMADGSVRCWGDGTTGQLGNGSTVDTGAPVPVTLFGTATQLASHASAQHTCAIRSSDGGIRCWGANSRGQLGDNTTMTRSTSVGVSGLAGLRATGLALGALHTCAIFMDGSVRCWGWNMYGQLGNGVAGELHIADASSVVTDLSSLTVTQLVAGGSFTCALIDDGTARCWGRNIGGQLGDGTTTDRPRPVMVLGLTDAVQLTAGTGHVCAVLSTGELSCWGDNDVGEVGDGTTSDRSRPLPIAIGENTAEVRGGGTHTCARTASDVMWCWGNNLRGQLGIGVTGGAPSWRTSPLMTLAP